ncbi:Brain tumor protein, partial [Stylophora pistillata]
MEYCCVKPWSLGQEGEKEHKLKSPRGIATNSGGEFIVGEWQDGCVKVFDSSGKFVKHFSLPNDDVNTMLYIHDVATDTNDNIFVLTELTGRSIYPLSIYCWIYKLTKTGDPYHRFRLRTEDVGEYTGLSVTDTGKVLTGGTIKTTGLMEDWGWYTGLSVSDTGKVLTGGMEVEEYDSNGEFVRSFGEGVVNYVTDVTVATDGRVMVMYRDDFWVYIFSEHGDYLNKFKLQRNDYNDTSITFHRTGEHVVIAGVREEKELLQVEIYSKDGEFVRSVEIQIDGSYSVTGITVTTEGHIAVAVATIGLLVRKGRNELAEKLKDGDVTDQKFHSLIVREIYDIKSKLDALSRKDFETSISFFEEGMALLFEVFEIAKSRNECGAATAGAACDEGFSLINGIRKLELTGLDESATTKLSAAKERFKDARKEATRAFKNEGLKISDRILAMKY